MGKERSYRVLVIAVSLRGNKIANFNDEIAESQFAAPIADLVSGGYIEEVTKKKKDVEELSDEAKKVQEEQAKFDADKKAFDEALKLQEEEAKKAEDDKANSIKTDDSDKKDETANLGDIANSIPGAKSNPAKK